jgi:hypothetical protein
MIVLGQGGQGRVLRYNTNQGTKDRDLEARDGSKLSIDLSRNIEVIRIRSTELDGWMLALGTIARDDFSDGSTSNATEACATALMTRG